MKCSCIQNKSLDQAIAEAHELSLDYCLDVGGYPDDIDGATIPGYVITATLDDAKERRAPLLIIQTHSEFIKEVTDRSMSLCEKECDQ